MPVKIEQDHEACIGCGACVSICPDNWEMTDDGKAKMIKASVPEAGCNKEAADACPVQCIKVIE
jgi:ferredoxin